MSAENNISRYGNNLQDDQLRLITLEPGKLGDDISCRLFTVERTDIAYKALSYAWGDTHRSYPIVVNDEVFYVHRNLYEALDHIRDQFKPVVLWTDAICIDQENTLERNAQVQRMGQTYTDAKEVVVWLGLQSTQYRALADVVNLAQGSPSWEAYATRLPSVQDVITRPWFRRLWAFQEAVLARKGIVMLGSQLCDLDVLLKLNIHILAANVNSPSLALTPSEHMPFVSALECFGRLSAARQWKLNGREVSQRLLIQNCQSLQCLDPRDHIYGVSGLAQSMGAKAEIVDYNLSVSRVFTKFMKRELFREPGCLIVHGAGENEPSVHKLPSWVPDFSVSTGLPQFYRRLYSAGGSEARLHISEKSFSIQDEVLALSGWVFDRILYISPTFRQDNVWSTATWHEVESLFLAYCPPSSPYPGYNGRLQAFWRTIIANCSFGAKDAQIHPVECSPRDTGWAYEVFIGRAEPLVASNHTSGQAEAKYLMTELFRRALSYALMNRRLFVTTQGYFGLGSPHVKSGDAVIVVPGLQMPYCAREREDGLRWRMLGPSYVHSLMKGEFMDQPQPTLGPQMFEFD